MLQTHPWNCCFTVFICNQFAIESSIYVIKIVHSLYENGLWKEERHSLNPRYMIVVDFVLNGES